MVGPVNKYSLCNGIGLVEDNPEVEDVTLVYRCTPNPSVYGFDIVPHIYYRCTFVTTLIETSKPIPSKSG